MCSISRKAISDSSGVIEARGWLDENYPNSADCKWIIQVNALTYYLNLFCLGWILQMINIDIFFSWKCRRLRLMEQHWRYPIVIRLISLEIMTVFQSLNCSNQYIWKLKFNQIYSFVILFLILFQFQQHYLVAVTLRLQHY